MPTERWREPLYLALFIVLVAAFWGVTLARGQEWESALQAMTNGVVIAAAIIITVREVVEMLAEAFRKKMREWAWEKGVEEGIERGIERGREEGREEVLDRLVREAVITEEQRKQFEPNGRS